jgi:hypothetical protein
MKALSAVFGGGWAFWALAALLFALLCWHLAANLLGMRPRRGTLEWIAERPAFSMEYGPGLGRDDLWPMAAAAAAVLLFRSFDGALTVRAAGVSGLDAAEYILLLTVSPVCASLGGYTLTKRFSGGPLAPLFGALLLGLNAGSPRALPFLAFSALFCLYHASGKAGAAWLSVLAGAAFWALAA